MPSDTPAPFPHTMRGRPDHRSASAVPVTIRGSCAGLGLKRARVCTRKLARRNRPDRRQAIGSIRMPSITLLARGARPNYVYELRHLNVTPETRQSFRDVMFDIKDAVDALPEASECQGKMARATRIDMALATLIAVSGFVVMFGITFGALYESVPLLVIGVCAFVLSAVVCYLAICPGQYARNKLELDARHAERPWREATIALLTPEKLAELVAARKLTKTLSLRVKLREGRSSIDMALCIRRAIEEDAHDVEKGTQKEHIKKTKRKKKLKKDGENKANKAQAAEEQATYFYSSEEQETRDTSASSAVESI